MTRAHRAGGPEYNPNTGMRVNQEHTSRPAERAERERPVEHPEEGVNFPYRGVEHHGVPYTETIPEELEGSPTREDLTLILPPHYAPKPHRPAPVPVTIADNSGYGIGGRSGQMWVDDKTPVMIVGRDLTRRHIIIHNADPNHALYIGFESDINANTGFFLYNGNYSTKFYVTDPIWLIYQPGGGANVDFMLEYNKTPIDHA